MYLRPLYDVLKDMLCMPSTPLVYLPRGVLDDPYPLRFIGVISPTSITSLISDAFMPASVSAFLQGSTVR